MLGHVSVSVFPLSTLETGAAVPTVRLSGALQSSIIVRTGKRGGTQVIIQVFAPGAAAPEVKVHRGLQSTVVVVRERRGIATISVPHPDAPAGVTVRHANLLTSGIQPRRNSHRKQSVQAHITPPPFLIVDVGRAGGAFLVLEPGKGNRNTRARRNGRLTVVIMADPTGESPAPSTGDMTIIFHHHHCHSGH